MESFNKRSKAIVQKKEATVKEEKDRLLAYINENLTMVNMELFEVAQKSAEFDKDDESEEAQALKDQQIALMKKKDKLTKSKDSITNDFIVK